MAEHFTATNAVLLCLLGFGVGVFGTLVGAGGGFILTPVLLLLYPHSTPALLTAVSLIVVFFNASSGSLAYARQRRIDYRSGAAFAVCTLPGAVLGVFLADKVSRPAFDVVMGIVLAALAAWLLVGPGETGEGHPHAGIMRAFTDREGNRYEYRANVRLGAMLSVAVGFVSSFLGIGGGVVHVPLLVTVLGFPTHVATATSHFVLAFMALVASLTHLVSGTFSHGMGLRRAAALSVGVVVGAQLGAWLSQRLKSEHIHRLLSAGLVILSARLILSAVV